MTNYEIKRGLAVVYSGFLQGSVQEKIMQEHAVRVRLSSPAYIDFRIGDTLQVYGKTYILRDLPPVRKLSGRNYEYSLEFLAPFYQLKDFQFFTLAPDNSLTLSDFYLNATPGEFLDLLIQNANRNGAQWVKGTVLEAERQNLEFSGNNCLEVLSTLATAFETEWHIDHRTIHLYSRGSDLIAEPAYDTGYTFAYGKGNGLLNVTRENQDTAITTRLYVRGSDRNITGDYRNYSTRLLMPASTGLYLSKNEDLYGVREETVEFDQIYPQRVGVVTAVNGIYKFTDSTIDFDVNEYLVPGVTVKCNFLTGQLAGYTFELLHPSGFNNATAEFTLIKNRDEKALDMPNELLHAEVGDLYVLSDLFMPPSYVQNAEADLQVVGQFYLDQKCYPRVQYPVELDYFYLRDNLMHLALAQSVRIIAPEFELDKKIRIIELERDINNPYLYKIVVAEQVKYLSAVLRALRQKQIDRIIKNRDNVPPKPVAVEWRGVESSAYCVQADDGSGNNGYRKYATLEEWKPAEGVLTGNTKPNVYTDADYLPPTVNTALCPLPTTQEGLTLTGTQQLSRTQVTASFVIQVPAVVAAPLVVNVAFTNQLGTQTVTRTIPAGSDKWESGSLVLLKGEEPYEYGYTLLPGAGYTLGGPSSFIVTVDAAV